jgi:hypothetical protein
MADLARRAELEQQLARELARLQQRELTRLLQALGDPPTLENLNPEYWNEFSTTLRGELTPTLEKVYLASAEQRLDTMSVGVDWSIVNKNAADWARNYTFDLVRGITENTRAALQAKLPAYFEQGQTIGQLRNSLQDLFGPVRAGTIAVTEISRAAVQGETAIQRELEKYGLRTESVFQTSSDDAVCPLCSPLNGKVVREHQFPPLHPRCRCWINSRWIEG